MQVSKELFLTHGYDGTTTKKIAQKAGIGEGTIFNYFGSKLEILYASMMDEISMNEGVNIENTADMNLTVEEAILKYIDQFSEGMRLFDKSFMREIIVGSLNQYKTNPEFLEMIVQNDYQSIGEIEQLLLKYKGIGVFTEDYDTKEAAEIVTSAIVFEYISYFYIEEKSFEDCYEGIKKKLHVLFHWTVKEK
ncbi:TetR/AcrR family transcriptional regulator [Chengkuizengella axinellae]|uniref:TetR/AcrR family transcriptional regulator n=1 Tax=Chengkuizengella axinellae TaxID=3064388 RepID=A0ABT9IZL2_9BACL|nr:TetR/AcrR family transcriptional regulator [Chengkuizengella sp. 2205SS18-9]MDP5274215.1 TetR/AcrR family transcriptional regulator [Chengkuizengella sp. 2205SS18-9]